MKSVEIERRFLVDPVSVELALCYKYGTQWAGRGTSLTQFYVSFDPHVRIRIYGKQSAELTIKGDGTLVRPEVNINISIESGIAAKQFAKALLQKERFSFDEWTIDHFGDDKWLAEIELENVDQSFERPAWLLDEVTHDYRFNSMSIATKGWPVQVKHQCVII